MSYGSPTAPSAAAYAYRSRGSTTRHLARPSMPRSLKFHRRPGGPCRLRRRSRATSGFSRRPRRRPPGAGAVQVQPGRDDPCDVRVFRTRRAVGSCAQRRHARFTKKSKSFTLNGKANGAGRRTDGSTCALPHQGCLAGPTRRPSSAGSRGGRFKARPAYYRLGAAACSVLQRTRRSRRPECAGVGLSYRLARRAA